MGIMIEYLTTVNGTLLITEKESNADSHRDSIAHAPKERGGARGGTPLLHGDDV